MKVVHIVQRFHPHIGGAETHVMEICKRLLKRGVEVEVYTADLSDFLPRTQIVQKIPVRRFKSWAPSDNFYFPLPEMWREIRSIRADIIHAHSIHDFPMLATAIVANREQKLILTPHYCGYGVSPLTNFLWNLYRPLAGWILSRADRIISVSHYETKILKRDFRIHPGKILMIPNGLDIKELKGVKYEPDPEEIRVLYVGRLVRNKNVDKLIQMIKILLTSSRFNNLKLVIVGDGSFKPKLLKLAKQLGVERHIEWKEYLSRRDLLHEYSRAKVFILPSQIEAFGIAAAEAIVIGVPTIVAKAGALIEYVKAGLARGIDLPVSGQAIASKVIEVMEDHTDTTSRSKGDYFYSWDEVVERILIAYRNCLG